MSDPRVTRLLEELTQAIDGLVEKHQVTHDEYRAAVAFVNEAVEGDDNSRRAQFDIVLEDAV